MEERKREMEIRRRNKEARQTALQSKVQDMKRKSADSEDWKRRKSQVYEMLPFCFGLVMMVAAGSYYFLKGWLSNLIMGKKKTWNFSEIGDHRE